MIIIRTRHLPIIEPIAIDIPCDDSCTIRNHRWGIFFHRLLLLARRKLDIIKIHLSTNKTLDIVDVNPVAFTPERGHNLFNYQLLIFTFCIMRDSQTITQVSVLMKQIAFFEKHFSKQTFTVHVTIPLTSCYFENEVFETFFSTHPTMDLHNQKQQFSWIPEVKTF